MKPLKIAIVGTGLIGGSLGLALKKHADNIRITGFDSNPASLVKAAEIGAIDQAASGLAEAVEGVKIVFFCTPVLQILKLLEQSAPFIKSGVIVSDVGSTKLLLAKEVVRLLPPGACYIGGHPMAGREKSGITAANADLFDDKMFILAPQEGASSENLDILKQLIARIGAKVVVMDVEKHDQCAAVISHIPHVAAAALVNLLGCYDGNEQEMLSLAGGGFCDTTRIASSNADMWADICLTNSGFINDGIAKMITILNGVSQAIEQKDRAVLHAYFKQAKTRRDKIIESL